MTSQSKEEVETEKATFSRENEHGLTAEKGNLNGIYKKQLK